MSSGGKCMGIFDKLFHKAAPESLIRTTSYGERYVVVKESTEEKELRLRWGSYHRRERYIGGWKEIARWDPEGDVINPG